MKKVYIVLIIIIVLLLIILGVGYARYVYVQRGNSETEVAKPICVMNVVNTDSDEKLNSYCDISVRNYNEEDEISEVSMSYEIEVTLSDGKAAPEYYLVDENGDNIGTEIVGTLGYGVKQENIHRICFKNYGEEEISKDIKFKLNAVQMHE